MDPELEGRIDDVARRTEQILGSTSMDAANDQLDGLAQREVRSGAAPLSEAERRRLAHMREGGIPPFDSVENFELMRLETRAQLEGLWGNVERPSGDSESAAFSRKPLSEAERLRMADLKKMEQAADKARAELQELESRVPLSRLESEMLRQGPELLDTWNRLIDERRWATNPRSLPVYENEQLEVELYEDDVFVDDLCLAVDVSLDLAILESGSLRLGEGVMTLKLAAVP